MSGHTVADSEGTEYLRLLLKVQVSIAVLAQW